MPAHFAHTLRVAQQFAHLQGGLALSPAEVRQDGTVKLCAAACVAFAAIQVTQGIASAKKFRAELASTANANVLEQTFEHFGFGKSLCSLIRIENDRLAPDARLSWFLGLTP